MIVKEFKEFMETHGFTQKEAADALNVSPATICRTLSRDDGEEISAHLAKLTIEYSIESAAESLSDGLVRLNGFLNMLIHASPGQ